MLKKKSNNLIKGQHQQDGPADWSPSEDYRAVSLKSIASLLDTTRSSARRWLKEAGIRPISFGRGAKGALRYRWSEVEAWLESRQYVE